jgi:hypothetical protein
VNSGGCGADYQRAMPRYRIRMINSQFDSAEDVDFPSLDAARKSGVATATSILGESIAEGEQTSAVELQIFEGEQLMSRQVIMLSVSELIISE